METNNECRAWDISNLLLRLRFFPGTTCESRDEETIVQCGSFSTRFFPFSLRFFFFPFPIVFRSRNFFFFFLSLFVSAFLSLNMSETRLNLFFLLWCCFQDWDGLTVNRHCFLFCLYFFYIFQENLRFFFRCFHFFSFPFLFLTVFLFLIWMLLSSLSLLFSLWVTWRSAQWCRHTRLLHSHRPSTYQRTDLDQQRWWWKLGWRRHH